MSRRAVAVVSLPFALSLAAAGAVAAQGPLDRVEALARAGRAQEARTLLTDWWSGDREGASREDRQRGIWLRGLLTVDPAQASLDFRRLVVEYPGGPYTARALARIAAAATVTGDTAEAVRIRETLVREHGGTPQGERAREWLEARREGSVPRGDVPSGAAGAGGAPAAGSRDAPRDTGARRGGGGAATIRGRFTVQLGAFATTRRARELLARARSAGLEPRLVRVPGSDLARVRVGRFVAEAEAEELRGRVLELGFDALVAGDAAREEPVGGG